MFYILLLLLGQFLKNLILHHEFHGSCNRRVQGGHGCFFCQFSFYPNTNLMQQSDIFILKVDNNFDQCTDHLEKFMKVYLCLSIIFSFSSVSNNLVEQITRKTNFVL